MPKVVSGARLIKAVESGMPSKEIMEKFGLSLSVVVFSNQKSISNSFHFNF